MIYYTYSERIRSSSSIIESILLLVSEPGGTNGCTCVIVSVFYKNDDTEATSAADCPIGGTDCDFVSIPVEFGKKKSFCESIWSALLSSVMNLNIEIN